jgi:hypothetical protein
MDGMAATVLPPPTQKPGLRRRALRRIEGLLRRRGAPRAHMALMVLAAGVSGFLSSVVLLHLGLGSMPIRYAASVALGYGVFLLLVRWWIARHRGREGRALARAAAARREGPEPKGTGRTPDLDCGCDDSACDLLLALDDLLPIVALVLALTISLASCVYVVFTAPSLFAELFLDGVLAAGLYRRLRRLERRHWLEAALRRTWVPALVVLLSVFAAGLLLHWRAPEARSVGEVWRHIVAQRR